MNENTGLPETLHEAITYFATGDNAWNFMVNLRWSKGVTCPTCGSSEVRFLAKRKTWECKTVHEKRQFSVKVGTIFEDSPIKLDKWFMAIWMVTNCKNGVSSYEIHRELGVTQKTGWFMLHRIRLAMEAGTLMTRKLSGDVEADETFIGGKAVNMHADVKARRGITMGNGMMAKTTVMGVLERPTDENGCSKVKAFVLPGMPNKRTANVKLSTHVEYWSNIFTDSSHIYDDAHTRYIHAAVDHAEEYVRGNVHTNGMENFWSLLKRSIKGTYVSVEPTHLFRYVGEQTFRFNNRKDDNHGRFLSVVSKVIGLRLTYRALITEDILNLPGTTPKRGKARA